MVMWSSGHEGPLNHEVRVSSPGGLELERTGTQTCSGGFDYTGSGAKVLRILRAGAIVGRC